MLSSRSQRRIYASTDLAFSASCFFLAIVALRFSYGGIL